MAGDFQIRFCPLPPPLFRCCAVDVSFSSHFGSNLFGMFAVTTTRDDFFIFSDLLCRQLFLTNWGFWMGYWMTGVFSC